MTNRIVFSRSLELRLPVERLWKVLADTDRINRALGLPPVAFTAAVDRTFLRTVTAKGKTGIPLSWEEPPFEWIEGRSYSVRRGAYTGPIGTPKEVYSGMRFTPKGEATLVDLFLELAPQNVLGGLIAKEVVGEKNVDALEKLCRELEKRLEENSPSPFPPKNAKAKLNLERMEQSMQALQGQVPQNILDLFAVDFRQAAEEDLIHMRPFALADRWRLPRMEVLRACLRAARLGALDVSWVILCPFCRQPQAEFTSLGDLRSITQCEFCKVEFKAEFDRNVEVRFSVNRSIRKTAPKVFCVGGPSHAPHRFAQFSVPFNETRVIEADLPDERFFLRALHGKSRLTFVPDAQAGASSLRIAFNGDEVREQEFLFKPGRFELAVENLNSFNLPLWATLDREAWSDEAATAALVTTLQEFRDLFSSEVLSPGEQINIKSLAIMFTDIKGSTALYEQVGDAKAYALVREHFRILTDAVRERRGAVVKTLGDAIMAVFLNAEDSLACAFDIQARFREQSAREQGIVVKLGIHLGPAIVVNTKDTLDYFGTSVNIASRIQATSLGGDIVVSNPLMEACRDALKRYKYKSESFEVSLKGLADEFQLWRLTPEASSPPS